MDLQGPIKFEVPLTDEVYCFTAPHKEMFYTLFFGPLLPYLVSRDTRDIRMQVGERLFIGSTDKPLFLIPLYSEYNDRYASHVEHFHFYPSGNIPENAKVESMIPLSYNKGIYPHFHFQINQGKLYKQENNKWIHVPI